MAYNPDAESEYHVLKLLMPLAGYEDVVTYSIFFATLKGFKFIASADSFDEAKQIIGAHMDRKALDE
jgi:hypothetical protein